MKFEFAVFVVGFSLCFGYPTEKNIFHNGDKLSDMVKSDFENNEQKSMNFVNNDEWSLVPLANGSFRLVNVKEVEEEYKNRPQARSEIIVTFQLHTLQNIDTPQFVHVNNLESLEKSNFDPDKPTKFVTHGWLNHAGSHVNLVLRKAILDNCDCNLFVVDWSSGANTLNYVSARYSVPDAAAKLSEFLQFLNLYGNLDFKDVTLIGHSLGAHVSGLAGKQLEEEKVHVIIGLDAASPLFSVKNPDERLAPHDADYVQTIHTSGGSLAFLDPLGQASFYPNWGEAQPGCGLDPFSKCAHTRSYEYYAESLYSGNDFIPYNCLDYNGLLQRDCELLEPLIRMGGEPAEQQYPQGIYFVPTHSESPFGMGGVGFW